GVVDGGEVLAGDDERLDLHPAEQALPVTRREVGDRLLENRPARGDDREVAVAALGEVLDRAGNDVRLPDAGRRVDNRLERRLAPLDVVVLGERVGDRPQRLAVRLAEVEPRRDRVDRGVVDLELLPCRLRGAHAGAGSARGSRAGRQSAAIRYSARIEAGIFLVREPLRSVRRSSVAAGSTAVPQSTRRSPSGSAPTRSSTTSSLTRPSTTASRVRPLRPAKGGSGSYSYPSCAAVASASARSVAQPASQTRPCTSANIDGSTSSTRNPPPPCQPLASVTPPGSAPATTFSGGGSGSNEAGEAVEHGVAWVRANVDNALHQPFGLRRIERLVIWKRLKDLL